MKSRLWKAVSCGFAFATGHLTIAFGATIIGLGSLPGSAVCDAEDVSADGSVVVGFCEYDSGGGEAFRWTEATGMVGLGTLAGHDISVAKATSADGSVVVGYSQELGQFRSVLTQEAFLWTEATGMVGLGYLPSGGTFSRAGGVSADGNVVVGNSDSSLSQEAFQWTQATGMVGLGTLTGGDSSIAANISGNGNVVVGASWNQGDSQAVRWTEATGMVGLGYLPGGPGFQPFYIAEAASADGAVVVGRGGQPTEREAFRWTEATGMVGLGDLPGGSEGSQAFDVSADGSVVVGSGDWSTGGGWKAFIWDADNGMRNLQDVLIAQGADLTGWQLEIATAVSADGRTIVGDDDSRVEPYLAILDASSIPPTLIDLSGTIKTTSGTDICAMVLASGQFMFSCNPPGVFSLTDLPRENNGTAKRQIYADGFFPKIDILTESGSEAVVMTRSGTCPNYNMPYDPAVVPGSAGERINISGKVLTQNSQTPICAMVLANGKHTFSCDGTGSYALNIPLDTNGQFKLQVYADGFAPTIQTFDEFKAANDVRMARAAECQ